MNLTDKFRGDDRFHNRLLSYLNDHLPFQIHTLSRLRKNVYIAKANDLQFVIKGFSSLRRLKIQEAFTHSLKKAGFPYTYSFYTFSKEQSLYFKSHYYGCIEYLEKGDQTFYYDSRENCHEGLQLLQNFHERSVKLIGSYKTILPSFHLIDKWQERYQLFKDNLSFLSFFLKKEIIQELLKWAEWSLAGLKKEEHSLDQIRTVILHGDVAHHNFLRTSDGELFLIDFDLVSIGPEAVDYLQYANRILPFLEWSSKELASFELFQPYLQQKVFLYALGFPTDIFREWNRLVRERMYNNIQKVRPIMELTLGQFEKRRSFYHELVQLVE
ncbi:phosphotransferase [Bacillus sp. V3B]|uniref:phosphotransferase n=1 Tax=Bacillus sp. V3B TaxID=2804915 RepID=UPI002109E157|nr:phosphotransferase [Bacillus sp. V3B]